MGGVQLKSIGLLASLSLAFAGCKVRTESDAASSAPAAASATPEIVSTPSNVEMVLLPGGSFEMGNAKGDDSETPVHTVSVSGFAIDVYEVTQNQLAALELPNPSQFKGDKRPVEQMRWTDAALFCNERSIADNLIPCYDEATFACNFAANGYRLPTEAEWEYAARAGTTGDVYFASSDKLVSHACYEGTSQKGTDPVGSRRANAWGLYDVLGNVAEWCQDVYSPTYYAESPKENPVGPSEGPKRVLRGGSWKSPESECRVSARGFDDSGIADACFARNYVGFRCVRNLTAEEAARLNGTDASTEE
ncbi:MAG: SUMF1/EgtB/PvdO family nonheme iron enzyme [Planctomycetales bacterium]|nr:SUMF1/EgtB/PvdO family nonheme iron enzyme [Planctomycetales bacterium]